jgi:hypothetical protein
MASSMPVARSASSAVMGGCSSKSIAKRSNRHSSRPVPICSSWRATWPISREGTEDAYSRSAAEVEADAPHRTTVGAGLLISTLLFATSEIDDNREAELAKLTRHGRNPRRQHRAGDRFRRCAQRTRGTRRPARSSGSHRRLRSPCRPAACSRIIQPTKTARQRRPGAAAAIVIGSYWDDSLRIEYPIRQGNGGHRHARHRVDLQPMWSDIAHRMLVVLAGADGRFRRRAAPRRAPATIGLGSRFSN